MLTLHRVRQGFIEQRTATINRIRGLLSEFGIVLPLKAATVRREAASALADLPSHANLAIGDLLSELTHLDERVAQYDRQLAQIAKQDARAQQLMRLGGIGELTATATIAMIEALNASTLVLSSSVSRSGDRSSASSGRGMDVMPNVRVQRRDACGASAATHGLKSVTAPDLGPECQLSRLPL